MVITESLSKNLTYHVADTEYAAKQDVVKWGANDDELGGLVGLGELPFGDVEQLVDELEAHWWWLILGLKLYIEGGILI